MLGSRPPIAHGFDDAAADPPDAPRLAAVRDLPQAIEHVRQAIQMLGRAFVAEPLQQCGLEREPHAQRLRSQVGLRERRQCAVGGNRKIGVQIRREQRRFGQEVVAAARAKIVEQRQQDDRNVLVAALQALEVIGELHHAAHQHGIGFVALLDRVVEQRLGDALHFLDDHRGAVELDHAQRALHLMQVHGAAFAHQRDVGRTVDVRLECVARLLQGRIELMLDPVERSEVDVVLQFHAHPRSTLGGVRSPSSGASPAPSQPGSLKSATDRRRSDASCARLPIDSAVWLAPTDVCVVIS